MNLEMKPILLFSCLSIIAKSQECSLRNTSCKAIKTADGYKFPHEAPEGSEIYVSDNETTIAHGTLSTQPFTLAKSVIRVDNHSVITRECQDLRVKCFVHNGTFVKEICLDYKVTEDRESAGPSHSPWGLIIGPPVGVGVVLLLILCYCYVSWKKENARQHRGGAELQSFSRHIRTRCCFGKGVSQEESKEEETSLSAIPPYPRESGNGSALASVLVHSIDSTAHGETPPSLSLDHSLSNGGMQLSKNGVASAPDVNRATNPRAMHRSLRDDPGGVNDDKGNDRSREKLNGWTRDHGPEDHESEGLLLSKRAAIQSSDMTGGAAGLVNKRGSDPDQVSRCSTAPETDVESTPT